MQSNNLENQDNPDKTPQVSSINNTNEPEVSDSFTPNPKPSQKYPGLRKLYCIVLVLSLTLVFIPIAIWLYAASIAAQGASGSEYIVLGLWPLFIAYRFALPISIALLFGFPFLFRQRKLLNIFLVIVALGLSILWGWELYAANQTKKVLDNSNRTMTTDETIVLLENCKIDSLAKEKEEGDTRVYVSYKSNFDENGGWIWQPNYADASGYDQYVSTIKDLEQKCGTVDYSDNTRPESEIYSWISAEDAKVLLASCSIKTFGYSKTKFSDKEREISIASGSRTGILLTDYDQYKHIWVDETKEAELIPIARNFQKQCGGYIPQFWCGKYEKSNEIGKTCRAE